jgi:hypothetical protein
MSDERDSDFFYKDTSECIIDNPQQWPLVHYPNTPNQWQLQIFFDSENKKPTVEVCACACARVSVGGGGGADSVNS